MERHATRIGEPGEGQFPYWVETPSEQFIVYGIHMLNALYNFRRARQDCEPMLVRQMSDNE